VETSTLIRKIIFCYIISYLQCNKPHRNRFYSQINEQKASKAWGTASVYSNFEYILELFSLMVHWNSNSFLLNNLLHKNITEYLTSGFRGYFLSIKLKNFCHPSFTSEYWGLTFLFLQMNTSPLHSCYICTSLL